MKLWFFTREAFRAMRRNAAPTVAAIVTTAVTVVLLGVLFPVLNFASEKSSDTRDELQLRVAVYDDATPADIAKVQQQLTAIPHVKSVTFINKKEALAELRGILDEKDKSILNQLNRNPLPRNFAVKADDASNLDSIKEAIAPTVNGKPRPVNSVISGFFDGADRQPIESATAAIKVILAVISLLLIVASLMLIGNTIRLSIFTRRREVEVMRLVGATRWFIRWPFMIEGLIVGIAGSFIAILILWIGKITVADPLADSLGGLLQDVHTTSFAMLVVYLFLAAILVSVIGSGVTLRRFLRV